MKLSLKEFYENHGSKPSIYDSLPVRPRCDRDADQGLHLRLAQGCSVDCARAPTQQCHGPIKEDHIAVPGCFGSQDGPLVGDTEYYKPNIHHALSANPPSFSSVDRHGCNPVELQAFLHGQGATVGPYERHNHQPTNPHYQYRGGSIDGVPSAGAPPRAACMGPPSSSIGHGGHDGRSAHGRLPSAHAPPGSYATGRHPSFGPSGNFVAPRGATGHQHPPRPFPHGPPPGGLGGHPGSYAGHPSSQHVMPGGSGGYGMPAAHGVPPPPPPRRQPALQPAVGVVPATACHPHSTTAVATMHMHPAVAPPTAMPTPAQHVDASVAASSGRRTIATHTEGESKTTPFAAVIEPEAAVMEPESPGPTCPKNEFAERLAQRAMAGAAMAKSSLLAGGASNSLSSVSSLSRGDSVASKSAKLGAALDIPTATEASVDSDSSSRSEQGGVFVKPSHSCERPRLALKPRAAPLEARHTTGSGNYSSTSSDSGDAPMDHGSHSAAGSAASSFSGGRPRLHLLPRGSSMTDNPAGPAPSSAPGARKTSVFGEAKPREEVLKQRGLDPAVVDAAVEVARKPIDSSTAKKGAPLEDGAHFMSSRDHGEWCTVGGRKGSAANRDERGGAVFGDELNPFFGSTSSSFKARREHVTVPSASTFSRNIMRDGRLYGSPDRGASYKLGTADDDGSDEDSGMFRRALPTRALPLQL